MLRLGYQERYYRVLEFPQNRNWVITLYGKGLRANSLCTFTTGFLSYVIRICLLSDLLMSSICGSGVEPGCGEQADDTLPGPVAPAEEHLPPRHAASMCGRAPQASQCQPVGPAPRWGPPAPLNPYDRDTHRSSQLHWRSTLQLMHLSSIFHFLCHLKNFFFCLLFLFWDMCFPP